MADSNLVLLEPHESASEPGGAAADSSPPVRVQSKLTKCQYSPGDWRESYKVDLSLGRAVLKEFMCILGNRYCVIMMIDSPVCVPIHII